MSDWAGLAWLVVLLAGNAFFVGAEFAVIAAKRSQIEPLAEAGSKRAKTSLYAMENATLMLATSQLGITVCSLLILLVSEPAVHHLLEGPLESLGLPVAAVSTVAFILALLFVSYLHVVLGEMVPKNISFSLPDKAVLLLAPPLVFVSKVISPVIRSMNAIANGILRLTGVEPKAEATSAYTLDEVATIVAESTKTGMLSDHSGALNAAFEFTTKTVKDVTIPLEQLVTLPEDATPEMFSTPLPSVGLVATCWWMKKMTPPGMSTSRMCSIVTRWRVTTRSPLVASETWSHCRKQWSSRMLWQLFATPEATWRRC